jgi:RNA polymerase sigma-70 factor (ECF subfamily)
MGMPEKPQVDWSAIVDQIQQGNPAGEETLYQNLVGGARLFLQRRLGTLDIDDKVHDLFLTIVDAIRRGEIREPERLMGFVRTVLYRQLNLAVSRIIRNRETTAGIEAADEISGSGPTPEQQTLDHEKIALMKQVLREMNDRDFEVLTRSYIREQPQERICVDMGLTPTQFQLLKSRAKARLSELMRHRLARKQFNRQ